MKIAIISDVHGNKPALEAVFEDSYKKVERYWFLGDLFGYGAFPIESFQKMEKAIKPDVWLCGNHDLALIGNKEIFARMNNQAQDTIRRHREEILPVINEKMCLLPVRSSISKFILLSHGIPGEGDIESASVYDFNLVPGRNAKVDDKNFIETRGLYFPEVRVLIAGHSHRQTAWIWDSKRANWFMVKSGFGQNLEGEINFYVHETKNSKQLLTKRLDLSKFGNDSFLYLNPGSVGQPRDGMYSSSTGYFQTKYMIIDIPDLNGDFIPEINIEFRVVPYDGQHLVQKWSDKKYPEKLWKKFAV